MLLQDIQILLLSNNLLQHALVPSTAKHDFRASMVFFGLLVFPKKWDFCFHAQLQMCLVDDSFGADVVGFLFCLFVFRVIFQVKSTGCILQLMLILLYQIPKESLQDHSLFFLDGFYVFLFKVCSSLGKRSLLCYNTIIIVWFHRV